MAKEEWRKEYRFGRWCILRWIDNPSEEGTQAIEVLSESDTSTKANTILAALTAQADAEALRTAVEALKSVMYKAGNNTVALHNNNPNGFAGIFDVARQALDRINGKAPS